MWFLLLPEDMPKGIWYQAEGEWRFTPHFNQGYGTVWLYEA